MNPTSRNLSVFHKFLTGFFLAAALFLTGCQAGSPVLPPSSDYEQYTASSEQGETEISQEEKETRQAFDAFTEELFIKEAASSTLTLHSLLADPSQAGITERPISYGSASLNDRKADMEDTKAVLAQLESFSFEQLDEDQQLTFEILKEYLETALLSDGLELYDQPLAPTIGIQAQLPVILAEYSFYSKEDIDTYLALLAGIDNYYGQLGEFERAKAEAGLFISDASIDNIITSCEAYLIDPEDNFITQTFEERMAEVDGLTEEEKAAYRSRHVQVLKDHFVPAYEGLIDTLESLRGTGTNAAGMCGYPEGKAYYEYLVHGVTGMSYATMDDLKKAIETEMTSDIIAVASVIQNDPDIISQVYGPSFRFTEPEAILSSLQEQITADFPALPECSYTVKDIPKALELSLSPAFYILPPLDRYEDNVIYINRNERFQDEPLYPTLAHEGYPGHLYQTVYFINKNSSPIRHLLSFGSYTEGWATYVEFLSYFFDNGLNRNLQKVLMHNRSNLLGLHAYLDLQINYYGWQKDDVAAFLKDVYSISDEAAVSEIFQTMVENPANYLEYYVGYLEIASMRREAEDALEDAFRPVEFHRFLLDTGPAPFTVIRPRFKEWLEKQL